MRTLLTSLFFVFSFVTVNLQASSIINMTIDGDYAGNYVEINSQLEAQRFYVIFEANIGRSIASFKDRWGDDYNRNGYTEIQSLVFCNPWYVNHVLNLDPELAALCPLSMTLLQEGNQTRIMMLRPSAIKPGSPAQKLLLELEADLLKALTAAGAEFDNQNNKKREPE
ncbi:DUF302 domain-containing protein [Pontibacter sp. JAM-7]|uniref:DUF302 domain-containing protein n=1 Tax=Pontibacter sp. JAM-7 TaxID=3366581 RepID=UPI003AF751B6